MNLREVKPWHVYIGLAGLGLILALKRSRYTSPPEGYAPLESEAGCDPTEKPGVAAFRKTVLASFGGYDAGIVRECSEGGDSGHKLGKAWDWGVDRGGANVDVFLDWLFRNENEILRRAGITYVIYNRRIWNTRAKTWQKYTGTDPHTSHVHVSFGTPGAMGETSFYRE